MQTYKSVTRWPAYLTDKGETMSTKTGDRIFNPYRAHVARKAEYAAGYRLERRDGDKVYVHSTAHA